MVYDHPHFGITGKTFPVLQSWTWGAMRVPRKARATQRFALVRAEAFSGDLVTDQ